MTERPYRDESPQRSPEEAFALLGNETRIDIIRALNETSGETLSFSDLRDRVAVDDSGQFNYHLNKLIGSFVRRTDAGEYELTYAGRQVVGAIFSGTYNQRGPPVSFELDAACESCESPLLVDYERERVTISCSMCEMEHSSFGFPPGAFECRTHEQLLEAFDGWLRAHLATVRKGFCLNCAGPTHGSITDEVEVADLEVGIEQTCERCGERWTLSVGSYLLDHPDVVAFYRDHAIDLAKTLLWKLSWMDRTETTVLSADPWRIQFTIELDGDRLELLVEDDLSVTTV